MSSRFADPTSMRTWSMYHDENPKRPPPSPSNKAPPSKKLDAKSSRAVSEEPCLPSKASQPITPPSSESHAESCPDRSSSNRVVVDMDVFGQILELDEGDDREFSKDMVREYLEQTQGTIKLMDDYFTKRELTQLGKEGHFLKGSSAALGIVQVQGICEKIQHLGNQMDPDRDMVRISVEEAFAKIKPLLARLKDEHAAAGKHLNGLFEGSSP